MVVFCNRCGISLEDNVLVCVSCGAQVEAPHRSLSAANNERKFGRSDGNIVKKAVALFGVSTLVGLYTTFVLVMLWDWFVSPAFHVAEISFWVMFGLNLLVGLFREDNDVENETRFKTIMTLLDSCVPEHKRAELREELNELGKQVWSNAGISIVARIAVNTFTLGLGFLVHVLAS
jgi:hypothetical protein